MATLVVDVDWIEVEMSGLEQFGALQRQVRFRRSSIRQVTYVENARKAVSGFRAPGTDIPGRLALGTWRSRKEKTFVATRKREPGYVITLHGERFDRLIVSSPRLDELA